MSQPQPNSISLLAALERQARAHPDELAFHLELARAYRAAGRAHDAAAALRTAGRIAPESLDVARQLAPVLLELQEFDAAIDCCRRVLLVSPDSVDALCNLAFALVKSNPGEEAIALARRATLLAAKNSETHLLLVTALLACGRDDEAIAYLAKGIGRPRESAEMQHALAGLLDRAARFTDAAVAYLSAARSSPGRPELWMRVAGALRRSAQLETAGPFYAEMLRRFPNDPALHSASIYRDLYLPDANAESAAAAMRLWWQCHGEPRHLAANRTHENDRDPNRVLRVGYVSPDFREHPVSFFIEPILQSHHVGEVRVICYSDARRSDDVTARLRSLAVDWRDTAQLSDEAMDGLIRADRIDILVDLSQHLGQNRLTLFSRKPVPIQISYLGYPYSTGVETIDFRLGDPHLDPPIPESASTEKIARLPESYFCYRPMDDAPPITIDPPSASSGFVTFGSMNQLHKLNAGTLDAWANVLGFVPDSRLLAKARSFEDALVRRRFVDELNRRGIDSQRIEMQGMSPLPAAMDEFSRRADVMLDTIPYPGGTTSCHLLWMGLPVVTVAGAMPIHRMGATLLHNVGLSDLIGSNTDEFVRIAVELARDEPRRRSIRATLRETMRSSPLMNADRFVTALEAIYRKSWRDWCAR